MNIKEKYRVLEAAVRKIAEFDTSEEFGHTDEWTESESFEACQGIAEEALEVVAEK